MDAQNIIKGGSEMNSKFDPEYGQKTQDKAIAAMREAFGNEFTEQERMILIPIAIEMAKYQAVNAHEKPASYYWTVFTNCLTIIAKVIKQNS